MTRFRPSQVAAPLALAGALAVGVVASAQAPQQPPAASHAWRGGPDGAGFRARLHEGREQRHAQMIADWTTVLKLSPSQAQQLSAVVNRPQPPERAAGMAHDNAMETTPQRLDHMQARMAEHEAHMREHLAAMKSFYASLSPDQQKTFDAVSRLSHHGMRHGHGMAMGRGPHGMGGRGGPGGPPPSPGE